MASSVGTAIVLVAGAEDIISLVRTARQVATGRAQERFRALFMATPLAVLSFDAEGLITSWNPGAQKVFGFLEADVIGKLNPTVPPDLLSEHRRLLKNTLDGSITTGFETTRLRQDGTKISVRICCAPLFEPDGKQTGVMATIEDISERRRMELELRAGVGKAPCRQHGSRGGNAGTLTQSEQEQECPGSIRFL